MPYVNFDQCVNVSQDAVFTYLYMLGGIPFTSIHPVSSSKELKVYINPIPPMSALQICFILKGIESFCQQDTLCGVSISRFILKGIESFPEGFPSPLGEGCFILKGIES